MNMNMHRIVRISAILLPLLLAGTLIGCGGGSDDGFDPLDLDENDRSKPKTTTSKVKKKNKKDETARPYPLLATKNSTRVPGKNAIQDAAFVSRIVYPSLDKDTRPGALIFVDRNDWRAGVAASALVRKPLSAPILLSDDKATPKETVEAAESLQPTGVKIGKGRRKVKAIRVGGVIIPDKLRRRNVRGKTSYAVAASIDRLLAQINGEYSKNVVIVSSRSVSYALPAAAWAAKSGDPVLYVRKNKIPPDTNRALSLHKQPNIYVLGPKKLISEDVVGDLRKLGQVQRIAEDTAVKSAIAFASFQAPGFGWGVVDPGHGLVFVNVSRPLDAAASAPLAASGKYGPMLLIDRSSKLPAPDREYLLDIQPGYETDPSRGVYNHSWIMGNESTISVSVQAQIDTLTEIEKIKPAPNAGTVQ